MPRGIKKTVSVAEKIKEHEDATVSFTQEGIEAARAQAQADMKAREEARVVKPKEEPVKRRERIPLGVRKLKLDAPLRKGYVRRWINDCDGRIQDAVRAGYDFVNDDSIHSHEIGKERVARRVGNRPDGTGMMAFLMEIKEEWYREDQEEKEIQRKEQETGIFSNSDQVGADGQYRPRGAETRIHHD